MIFCTFFPSCPSCLAKCKHRLRNIFVTSSPKVTKNKKRKMGWMKHLSKQFDCLTKLEGLAKWCSYLTFQIQKWPTILSPCLSTNSWYFFCQIFAENWKLHNLELCKVRASKFRGRTVTLIWHYSLQCSYHFWQTSLVFYNYRPRQGTPYYNGLKSILKELF